MSIFSKIAIFFLSSFLCCLLAVLALDVVYRVQKGEFYFSSLVSPNSEASSRGNPDLSSGGPFNPTIYRDEPRAKSNGVYRVLTLGGSTTYGLGVSLAETWPKILESKMRTERRAIFADAQAGDDSPSGVISEFEVLNLGYLGGHLEQIRTGLSAIPQKRIARKDWLAGERAEGEVYPLGLKDLDPDLLILTPVVNDTISDYFYRHGPLDSACGFIRSQKVLRQSAVRYYVCKLAAVQGNRIEDTYDPERSTAIVRRFGQRLQSFLSEIDEQNVMPKDRIVLLALPFLFQEGDTEKEAQTAARYWGSPDVKRLVSEAKYYPHILKQERDMIRQVAERNGIRFVDLSSLYSELRFRKRLRVYTDSIHTDSVGTRGIAEALWAKLQTSN